MMTNYITTAHQMKKVDQYLINHKHYTMNQLISIAALKIYRHIAHFKSPLILCGPGNNGADGLAVAKLFKNDQKKVKVKMVYPNLQESKYIDQGDLVNDIDLTKYDVVVDAVFGYGLNRAIDLECEALLDMINSYDIYRISIDIPTNINADCGLLGNIAFKAHQTITFMALKRSMLNDDLKHYFGNICVESFGIENQAFKQVNMGQLLTQDKVSQLIKYRKYDDYKKTCGVVMHFTGSPQYIGASVLAAKGSLYSGCGMLKVVSDESVLNTISYHLSEPILQPIDQISLSLKDIDAILFGCGKGLTQKAQEQLEWLIKNSKVPLVIDADGLTILSRQIHLLEQAKCPIVLTPHLGELARLCPNDEDLIEGAMNLTKKYNVVCLVKGPHTMIINRTHCFYNCTGNPAMASAGMGDVLAGIIVSLLGQGYDVYEASLLGVYLHGASGDSLARSKYCVLASEVASQISTEMKQLVENKKEIVKS